MNNEINSKIKKITKKYKLKNIEEEKVLDRFVLLALYQIEPNIFKNRRIAFQTHYLQTSSIFTILNHTRSIDQQVLGKINCKLV